MPTTDPRIDAYIEKAPEFARPILRHLRAAVHGAVPGVEETMKWSSPHFTYHGMFCGMSAFKEHCAFGFWKHALMQESSELSRDPMGSFGRLTSLADLPPDEVLADLIRQAARLNEAGVKAPPRPKKERAEIPVPDDLVAGLEANAAANETWQRFSPSKRRDYLEWITEAKADATRQKRLATTLEWLAEGKARHWKYESC